MKLTHGVKFAPILPGVAPAILGTMPSIYQLLPRSRHGRVVDHHTNQPVEDLRDVKTWTRYGWGLANPNQADVLETLLPDIQAPDTRYQIALDHLDKCLTRASAFADAIDRPATPPPHLSLYLFAGDAVDTNARARVDLQSGSVWVDAHAPGDGTVLRSSALMDERTKESWTPRLRSPIDWDQVFFLFTDHLGITKDPAFSDTTLYLLLEAPRSSSDSISD